MTPHRLLVTGANSGLGRSIAMAALADGHQVVGTVRRQTDAAAFEALAPGRSIARLLDVRDDSAVHEAVDEIESSVGPITVAIANAGYGHEGIFEESPMAELRDQFAVNVFGAVATMQAVLPHMRARRVGRILGITSMGGLMTVPGLSYYHGSKYALEGILETLGKEVRDLGIRVTAVAPGSFRTDWAGRSMVRSPRSIGDYDPVMGPVRRRRQAMDGNQLGDPAKAARVIVDLFDHPDPPAHLLLGSDALRLVAEGRAAVDAEIDAWDAICRSTDYSDAP